MPPELEPDSQNPDNAKYVSIDDIGNIVNSAVTSHLKRSLGSAIDAALKPVLDKLATPASANPPGGDDDDGGRKRGRQSPEMLAMSKQIEDMQKELKLRDERVAAAEKKAQNERAYNELRTSLEGKVRPELLDIVAKHLFLVENRVEHDDAGTPIFKTTKVPYTGADPEEMRLPLRAGVDDFLKSDAAKAFLPPPSPGGTTPPLPKRGFAPSTATDFTKTGTTDADRTRRAMEREARAKAILGQ